MLGWVASRIFILCGAVVVGFLHICVQSFQWCRGIVQRVWGEAPSFHHTNTPSFPPQVKGIIMSADISLSCPALAKILLHAARYSQTAVSGVVLAPARGGGGGDGTTPSTVMLVDAVPLFHLNLSLAPMLEVALTQVWMRDG